MNKFKVGDRVKTSSGYSFDPSEGTVVQEQRDGDLCSVRVDNVGSGKSIWGYSENDLTMISKAKRPKAPKFLLQYDREEDPIEEFQTLVAVKERIAELTEDNGVQQGSYKVYKIEKVYEVNITKQVELK